MGLSGRRKVRIGDILINEGILSPEQLDEALALQKEKKKRLGEILVEEGFISDETMANALCHQLGYARADLQNGRVPDDLLSMFEPDILKKYSAIPYMYDDRNVNVILMAMSDPMDMLAIDDLSMICNRMIQPVVATPQEIMLAIDKYFGNAEAIKAASDYEQERADLFQEDEIDKMINDDVNNSPIVQLVNSMLEQAVRQRTSDIHIEALERNVRVRYRIDGALFERMTYNIKLLPAIVARLKVIGGMDISEKRKPQDGRITTFVDGREYDIRVSILPTVYGEKTVMRITNKGNLTRDISELGFNDEERKVFTHILKNPYGIILVTGPTGSGKSTTLYTALSELNTEDVNIITVEDPVEANVAGINQVQTNVKAGLTFASALRSILRQDPDIIMIGEIRDGETASIAVQASITGHLVVSTLHTNSAASTVSRLADMGVESYLIADSVVGIIAQRLVRRLCPRCKEKRLANADELEVLGFEPDAQVEIHVPKGCPNCDNSGYRGRIGVYEIMEVSNDVKRIIARGGDADQIKEAALKNGMNTLRMSATRYVLDGITSVSEMIKVSFEA
ncbi:MAG: Flp pilus assembly complex ATPase component TadA [Lachnospiraceae bacterium]|nr:Flp pilus assembly complex ATPase component TadA [Lachnospiraceae bacterium]